MKKIIYFNLILFVFVTATCHTDELRLNWSTGVKWQPATFTFSLKEPPRYSMEYSLNYTHYLDGSADPMRLSYEIPPGLSLDVFIANGFGDNLGISYFGTAVSIDWIFISAGMSFEFAKEGVTYHPYLGFRIHFISVPPVGTDSVGVGFNILPMAFKWSLITGRFQYSLGICSLTFGYTSFRKERDGRYD